MSISGKYLGASVNGTPIDGTHEWSVNETGDKLEATSGADRGRGRKNCGVIDTMIKVKFYLDISTGLMGFIRTGTILSNVQLFLDAESPQPLYTIAEATVYVTNVGGQVRDRFVVDADLEANGDVVAFSDPA